MLTPRAPFWRSTRSACRLCWLFGSTRKTPGEFGLEIRDSFDHADPAGDPLATRIVIGRTNSQTFATETLAEAEQIDVGNYQQHDEAAVSTNFIEGLISDSPTAKPGNRSLVIDVGSEYMAWFISHEFGHLVGLHQTQFTSKTPSTSPSR